MCTPWISNVLHVKPVSLNHSARLLATALSILLVMELCKLFHVRVRPACPRARNARLGQDDRIPR
ncbi:MAG: hypothetical protein ACE368_08550 [Paracoccaceae bacterium]